MDMSVGESFIDTNVKDRLYSTSDLSGREIVYEDRSQLLFMKELSIKFDEMSFARTTDRNSHMSKTQTLHS